MREWVESAPSGVRDDVKLGGLGLYAALGRRNRTALGSPSPPLLHEVKLSGPVAGGPAVCRLRQEGKLALRHEVKLSRSAAGGSRACRLRQEGKLALRHEVKLSGSGAGCLDFFQICHEEDCVRRFQFVLHHVSGEYRHSPQMRVGSMPGSLPAGARGLRKQLYFPLEDWRKQLHPSPLPRLPAYGFTQVCQHKHQGFTQVRQVKHQYTGFK